MRECLSPWWSISNDDEMIAPRIFFCDYLICTRSTSELVDEKIGPLASVAQRVDNAIHWINLYPVDNATDFVVDELKALSPNIHIQILQTGFYAFS